MPKIGAQHSSKQDQERFSTGLETYFCCCQEFALVIDKKLSLLARRRSDGAFILRNEGAKKHAYKLQATTDSKPILIRREGNALEKQWALRCQRCDLKLGYEVRDPKGVKSGLIKKAPYSYIAAGALSVEQSVLPSGVFDLEPWKKVAIGAATEASKA